MPLQKTTVTICGLLIVSFAHGNPVGDCHRWNPLNQAYHLADDMDCSVFYKCSGSRPVKLVCPEGLHFNRRLELCDYPGGAGCSEWAYKASLAGASRHTPVVTKPLKQPLELCPAPVTCPKYGNGDSVTVHVPHAYNCSKFCKCHRGLPVAIDCPRGLHFNAALEVCDWPETAGCSITTAQSEEHPSTHTRCTNPVTDTSKSAPSISEDISTTLSEIMSGDCPAVGSCPQHEDEKSIVKHLPHAYNCSQFCKCHHGVPFTIDCLPGLHFNPMMEVCDWPQNANCFSTVSAKLANIPTTVYTTLQTNPTHTDYTISITKKTGSDVTEDISATQHTTTEPTTEGTSVSPSNTFPTQTDESFYTVTEVTSTVSDDTTVSAQSTVWLDTYTSSSATSSPCETTTVITSSATEDDTVLPRDENACGIIHSCPQYAQQSVVKQFPHPTNCSLYCRCNHGGAITQICPAGLHFNAKLEVCDWPSSANCK